jgi:hypothetical protein
MTEIGAKLQSHDLVGVHVPPRTAVPLADDALSAVADVVARGIVPDGVQVSGGALLGARGEECKGMVAVAEPGVDRHYLALCERRESAVMVRIGGRAKTRFHTA